MASAQESVGSAKVWPIAGSILSAADPTRQGAAATPHPANAKVASIRIIARDADIDWFTISPSSRAGQLYIVARVGYGAEYSGLSGM
jgi:hypothetical protein